MQTAATSTLGTLDRQPQAPALGAHLGTSQSASSRLTNRSSEAHGSSEQRTSRNRTALDLTLARAYWIVLLEHARSHPGKKITYGRMMERAKLNEPDNPAVQKSQSNGGVGRRLEVMRQLTDQQGLPDLSALAVKKLDEENGGPYREVYDGAAIRQAISELDWDQVTVSFDQLIAAERVALEAREAALRAARRKKVPEGQARQMLWLFSEEHPEQTAGVTYDLKEASIKLIMRGLSVPEAIQQAREAAQAKRSGTRT